MSSMLVGHSDSSNVRRANLSVVLRLLRLHGPQSRAALAASAGLTRATMSSLVAELTQLGLVHEGVTERGGVGRPGRAIELSDDVCGLGIEINLDYVAAHVLDLRGHDVLARRVVADAGAWGPGQTLDVACQLASEVLRQVESRGGRVAGVAVAVPGLVETAAGLVRFAPNLDWHDVAVADEVRARLGRPELRVVVDNDANLSALAEYVMGASAGTPDLVYLTGEVGVGAGLLVGGRLLRGAEGFGGEVGHMVVSVEGLPCGCGRRGCWETLVGLQALLRAVAKPGDPVADPSIDLETRMGELRARAEGSDAATVEALRVLGRNLGLGASTVANIVNPQVIVLGGYFAVLAEFILPAMRTALDERLVAPSRNGRQCRVEASRLGFTAAARGGAHVLLESVLTDPTSVAPVAGAAHV